MMRRTIFLDVDGVLNCETTRAKVPYWKVRGIEKRLVRNLKQIVDATGAEIILSSTWKDGWAPEYAKCKGWVKYLRRNLEEEGMQIAGVTPEELRWVDRGNSIREWIDANEPDEYVVIDDEFFASFAECGLTRHVVHTSPLTGISDQDVEMAIQILTGNLRAGDEKELAEMFWKEERARIRKFLEC